MSSYQKTIVTQIQLPPVHQIHPDLPYIIDDYSLALHLGVKCKTLWYCIVQKERLYKRFTIAKHSSPKRRVLHAPKHVLKFVQKRVNYIILKRLAVLDCVGAYVPGRSCRYSAERHAGHAVRIGLDIKDFFPSHTKFRVRTFFENFCGYSSYVSELLAHLCTTVEMVPVRKGATEKRKRHFVPQGSPASPTLCNLIAQETLDKPLLMALEGTGWVYTRYADDLTLSHPDNKARCEVDEIIDFAYQCVERAGYRPNYPKTKIQRQTRRQKMLGMVVNVYPNIPRPVYEKYKAVLTNCIRDGFEVNALRYGQGFENAPEAFPSHLLGKLNYFHSVNPAKAGKLRALLTEAVAKDTREKGEAPIVETIE